jgi:hypothetical protein
MLQLSFRLADLILVALICLLILRLVLAAVPRPGSAVHRGVRAVTDPVVNAFGAITPRIVPLGLVTASVIFWALSLRILLFIAASAMAMRRTFG